MFHLQSTGLLPREPTISTRCRRLLQPPATMRPGQATTSRPTMQLQPHPRTPMAVSSALSYLHSSDPILFLTSIHHTIIQNILPNDLRRKKGILVHTITIHSCMSFVFVCRRRSPHTHLRLRLRASRADLRHLQDVLPANGGIHGRHSCALVVVRRPRPRRIVQGARLSTAYYVRPTKNCRQSVAVQSWTAIRVAAVQLLAARCQLHVRSQG